MGRPLAANTSDVTVDEGAAELRRKGVDSSKRADRFGKPGGTRSGQGRAAAEVCIKRTNSDIIDRKEGKMPGTVKNSGRAETPGD